MKTKFNFDGNNLYMPIAFRPEFNQFAPISSTQAWSLFFTGSHEDTALGNNLEEGRFWNNMLAAGIVTSILGILIFQNF
jgi:hypothetical protein